MSYICDKPQIEKSVINKAINKMNKNLLLKVEMNLI